MGMHKVLVVDDSKTDLTNLEGILSAAGCVVLTSTNGQDAIEKAKAERPELIFLDIIMPEMDGYEACRKLAEDVATKDIPVVFVTSKNQKADRVWALMQGAKDLVTKPYTDADILPHLGPDFAPAPAGAATTATPEPGTSAEVKEYMLAMLQTFTNPVRVKSLCEAISAAADTAALEAQIDAWHTAIAESPNGIAEVDRLRKKLDAMLRP